MANPYRLSGCPRSTLRDFIAIAELKKVDTRAFESALANFKESQRARANVQEKPQVLYAAYEHNAP